MMRAVCRATFFLGRGPDRDRGLDGRRRRATSQEVIESPKSGLLCCRGAVSKSCSGLPIILIANWTPDLEPPKRTDRGSGAMLFLLLKHTAGERPSDACRATPVNLAPSPAPPLRFGHIHPSSNANPFTIQPPQSRHTATQSPRDRTITHHPLPLLRALLQTPCYTVARPGLARRKSQSDKPVVSCRA